MTAPADPSTPDPRTSGRATLYRGIRMRSRLEADYAAFLDRRGLAWTYEPQCFADATGQYLPDFRVQMFDGNIRYAEIKPTTFPLSELEALQRKMGIIWSSEPTAVLSIHLWSYQAEDLHRGAMWVADRLGCPWEPVDLSGPRPLLEVELVSLVCGCGHTIAGLPTENLPCWICQYGDAPPFGDIPAHHCTLAAVA